MDVNSCRDCNPCRIIVAWKLAWSVASACVICCLRFGIAQVIAGATPATALIEMHRIKAQAGHTIEIEQRSAAGVSSDSSKHASDGLQKSDRQISSGWFEHNLTPRTVQVPVAWR